MASTANPPLHLRPAHSLWGAKAHTYAAAVGLCFGVALAAAGCADVAGPSTELPALDDASVGEEKAAPSLRYEAENRTAQSGCSVASNKAGFTGTGFMDFGGNSSWIEWNNVNAAGAGDYTLTLRYANGGSAARPAVVAVNGRSAGSAQFSATGSWTTWKTTSLTVSLKRGLNTIRLTANTSAGGPNVDHVELTVKDLCPSDPNKTEPGECGCGVAEGRCGAGTGGRYEAENRTAQNGCSLASNNAGFTGSGFMDFGGNGSWIEWNNVSAAAAGSQTLTLRYANGGAAARPAVVTVNGQLAGVVQFSATGSWTTWKTASIPVSLRSGANTIRVTANTGAGGPNVDHAELSANGGTGGGTGGGSTGGSSGGTAIKLPIEVLGPAGTRESVQVRIDNPSNVTHLYLRCNACGYHDEALDGDASKAKATVRINGGAPVALKHYKDGSRIVGNSRIEVIGAEADYGGIGGAFRTVRIKVPVTGLVAGVNTITFEHARPAAPSIGFRILELNLLRGGSLFNRVLTESSFVRDDPATWTAPSASAADVSAGKALWEKRSSLYDPGVDALDGALNRGGPLTGNIVASCADCHAGDGRDLAYFNFSNHSIIERSYFHGLSRQDGSRIASYIRSLKLPIVRSARPWNPTYQPGPGLDSRPVYEWAAGAGIDAILDSDAEMEQHLFPRGDSLTAVRQVVDRYATLNLRELPISLPMPEWNQWLPLIHPDDAFNTQAAAIRADYKGVNVGKPYYTALYETAKASPTSTNIGRMTQRVKSWLQRGMTCSSSGPGNGEPWRGINGPVLDAMKIPLPKKFTSSNCNDARTQAQERPFEIAKHGLAAWLSVKQWEIVHRNNLETEGSKLTAAVCSSGRCVNASERRGWVVDGRNVFDRAPHFLGHASRNFHGQSKVAGVLESNAWYHLNMILNPGYRRTMPSHFAYTYSHVEILQEESKVDQGFRFWATMIKQRQLQTNGRYGVEEGLDLRTAQPYVYYSSRAGSTAAQGSVGQPLRGRLAQAMIEDFVADANNATAQDWANATQNRKVQPRDSTDFSLCESCFASGSRTKPFELDAMQGRNTYRVIPRFREIGVASSVISSLIDWGKKTWPRGNWDALR
jgi:hypothetical protein